MTNEIKYQVWDNANRIYHNATTKAEARKILKTLSDQLHSEIYTTRNDWGFSS